MFGLVFTSEKDALAMIILLIVEVSHGRCSVSKGWEPRLILHLVEYSAYLILFATAFTNSSTASM